MLPPPVQAIALLNPLTWWIGGVRQSLFPGGIDSIGGPATVFESWFGHVAPSAAEIVIILLVTGAIATLGATVIFRISERRAKDRGLLDMTTGS